MPTQRLWLCCYKCLNLFYGGYQPDMGVCSGGGSHAVYPEGTPWDFWLPYDEPTGPNKKGNWRYCVKCKSLHLNSENEGRGVCPAGGPHEAAGYHFVVDHNRSLSPQPHQYEWRLCFGCNAMFYNGYNDNKGQCPNPSYNNGKHFSAHSELYNFVLLHDVKIDVDF